MSASCLRWLLGHVPRDVCSGASLYSHKPPSALLSYSHKPPSALLSYLGRHNPVLSRWSRFATTADTSGEAPPKPKKKRDPRARETIGSVGRKITQKHLQVISETGENLGTMHRADVIRVMDERGLKLVPLNEFKDPPLYRLLSGKQIHEQQLQLREKQKTKGGPVQVKELTFSSDIAANDLVTKLKQVQSWLDKKHHVKITLRSGRTQVPQKLDATLGMMVQQIEVMVGFVSEPRVVREGKSAMCVLRPPSAKELRELAQKEASKTAAAKSLPSPTPAQNSSTPGSDPAPALDDSTPGLDPTPALDGSTDTKDSLPN